MSLAALAAALLSTTALAQSDTSAASEEVIVTASRAKPVPQKQYGGSSTTISSLDLTLRQTIYVSDVLRDVPGVSVNRSGGFGGATQIRMRGTEANHTLVLIDGIEASDPFQGEFDFATLIADDVASIEVLRPARKRRDCAVASRAGRSRRSTARCAMAAMPTVSTTR